jgi:hypothetical protein
LRQKLIWSDPCQAFFSARLFRAVPVGVPFYPFLLRGSKTTDEAGRFDDESL